MSDLMERLRAGNTSYAPSGILLIDRQMLREAADEIERLTKQLDKAHGALKGIQSECERWRSQQPESDGASRGWALHLGMIATDALPDDQQEAKPCLTDANS